MGTGASKGAGPKSKGGKNFDDQEHPHSPTVTLTRKKNHALKSANQLPKLPEPLHFEVKDVKRTIVGLDESDDENSFSHVPSKVRDAGDNKKLESKLKRDIIDLENTLTDLETSDELRSQARAFNRASGSLARATSVSDDNSQNYFGVSQISGSKNLPTTAHRRASYGLGAKGFRQYPRQFNMSNRHVSSVKFSWQQEGNSLDKDNKEEWTYKQVFR